MERGKQLEKDFKAEKSHKDYEEQFGMSYESTKKTKENSRKLRKYIRVLENDIIKGCGLKKKDLFGPWRKRLWRRMKRQRRRLV